ncbi:hypothetical protein [Butyrivibrio proteoclasticus]|uniref:hypothetical protein n=1 Tax=Butyrivibrio proteoclasticus TaxID=43305 RepID=UPI00047EF77C|nr:hypothetical protein [Butyrivibrio proteoclasticus]
MTKTMKRICAIALSTMMCVMALTGCSSKDKAAIKESATGFLDSLKDNNLEQIAQYSTKGVAEGEFVRLFDSSYMEELLNAKKGDGEISDEAKTKLDEFYALLGGMIDSYEITDVTINKGKKTATAEATITTTFPVDIQKSQAVQDKISAAVEEYNTQNAETINALIAEQGEEAASNAILSDVLIILIDSYTEAITSSQGETYRISLDLQKDDIQGKWLVSDVTMYRDNEDGTAAATEAAQETATTGAASDAVSGTSAN